MNPELLIHWIELQLGCKRVKIYDRFYEDLGAESIDMLHLMVMIEENTGIFIPEELIPELKTVQKLYEYILEAEKNEHI